MVEPIEAFPLQWPTGFERAKSKKASAFKVTLAGARDGVLLIKKYHPDNPETGNEYKFLKIQEAYAKAMKYDEA